MGDSRLIKNIQDSVTNFETECSGAIRRSRIDDDEEIRRLEEKLEVAMQNFERNLDMELERYSTAVKEKKPSVGTPVGDRAYDAYRVVLKDANTNLNKISGWLNCIFNNHLDRISFDQLHYLLEINFEEPMASSNRNNDRDTPLQRTQTLMLQQQVQEKLRPLTLRLSTTDQRKVTDIEHQEKALENQMTTLKKEMNHQIDQLQKHVLSCKPKETKDVNYVEKIEAYKSLLMFVTQIMEEMRELIITLFDRHRLFIHQVWQALKNDEDCGEIHAALEKDVDRQLQRWERFLNMVDARIKMTSIS
ncbi:unnamed protein product [Rotaria magnacalcarata]|nr:unnamed protein product [Rotaria magnacalcarata]CAF1612194.1 unnamed protein product [Rotaria magnacalcarata]